MYGSDCCRHHIDYVGIWLCNSSRSFVDSIDAKHIPGGVRRPSSRALAATLTIWCNTAIAAIDALIEQGYLVAKDRSGVFVAREKRDIQRLCREHNESQAFEWPSRLAFPKAPFEDANLGIEEAPVDYNFKYGQFDMSVFPVSHWRQCERSALDLAEIRAWGRNAVQLALRRNG